ncbi:sodium:calcium antiporter [Candidatus Woesearchaeota archaeon]|nr:sodium:calcium antiporter [Candidatus Woesearchaeota archaeon]
MTILDSISKLVLSNPLYFNIAIVVLSLIIIVKSADYLVSGVTSYSKKLGLSDYITGMIVVALAASVPELVSSLTGLFAEQPGIIFGTIIGSNVAGMAIVLGILAVMGRKINLKSKVLAKTEMIIFFFSMVPFLMLADGTLSRIDGTILLILYFSFVVILWIKEGELGGLKKDVKLESLYKDGLLFILALGAILLSARWLVFSAIEVATILGLSPYYVSLLIIGIGSTIPDLTVSIRALLQGHKDVGIGDALGSTLIKSLLFLGIFALIRPLSISFTVLLVAVVFSVIIRGVVFYFTEEGSMKWKHGLLLLLIYFIFIIIESLKRGA